MKINLLIYSAFISFFLVACQDHTPDKGPNVILIMADDMGRECLSCYGSTSYETPVLDKLASNGIRFSHCISQPLCTPSRVKIMTGLYNHRNYSYFGYLNDDAYTFGNLMKDAGYATCIAGKWQLNGLAYKNKIPDWNDHTRPEKFGFDEYCLWQLTKSRNEGERYADPLIEKNGYVLENDTDDYGPDIFANFILDFIDRKKDEPFFVYYPMVLVHDPFVPTPDSEEWHDQSIRYTNDTAYFKDMVSYTDKIVGKIIKKLEALDIVEHTIIIFTGDNGTHPSIYTQTNTGKIQGGKGNTIDAGVHVPMIAFWPQKIKEGLVFDELIEFSDFYPTLAEIVGRQIESDGKSFYPLISGKGYEPRKTAYVYYDPKWSENVNQYRNQFIQTLDYKLYQDGRFFRLANDILEQFPIQEQALNTRELEIKFSFEKELKKHPVMN